MALEMKISGANYVSDKRRTAFEQALAEGPVVAASEPAPVQEPVAQPAAPIAPAQPTATAPTSVVVDYGNLLGSLERGLSMSFDHQEDTLRVHEQYLRNQAEYAAIFSQLMEQQSNLFAQGAAAPTEALTTVLQTLGRSVEQFHNHQGDTLSVHNSFLGQQSEYAREFVSLLRQQYGGMTGTAPALTQIPTPVAAPSPVVTPQATLATSKPAMVVAPVAPPTPEPVTPVTAAPTPPPASVDLQVVTASLLDIVAEKTGYPADMLELDMDMEADLGIDSIKRVEILGALQDAFPTLPEIDNDALAELRTLAQIIGYMGSAVASEPAVLSAAVLVQAAPEPVASPEPVPQVEVPVVAETASAGGDVPVEAIQATLLDVVADKTGYPADMLELDMDMEADLGIDSIKRVEILGAMQDAYPSLPELSADALAELRTIGQIIEALNSPVEVTLKKV